MLWLQLLNLTTMTFFKLLVLHLRLLHIWDIHITSHLGYLLKQFHTATLASPLLSKWEALPSPLLLPWKRWRKILHCVSRSGLHDLVSKNWEIYHCQVSFRGKALISVALYSGPTSGLGSRQESYRYLLANVWIWTTSYTWNTKLWLGVVHSLSQWYYQAQIRPHTLGHLTLTGLVPSWALEDPTQDWGVEPDLIWSGRHPALPGSTHNSSSSPPGQSTTPLHRTLPGKHNPPVGHL